MSRIQFQLDGNEKKFMQLDLSEIELPYMNQKKRVFTKYTKNRMIILKQKGIYNFFLKV